MITKMNKTDFKIIDWVKMNLYICTPTEDKNSR